MGKINHFWVKTDEHNCIYAIAPVTEVEGHNIEDYFRDWVEVTRGKQCGWVGPLDVCGIPLYKVEDGEIVLRSDAMLREAFEVMNGDE